MGGVLSESCDMERWRKASNKHTYHWKLLQLKKDNLFDYLQRFSFLFQTGAQSLPDRFFTLEIEKGEKFKLLVTDISNHAAMMDNDILP